MKNNTRQLPTYEDILLIMESHNKAIIEVGMVRVLFYISLIFPVFLILYCLIYEVINVLCLQAITGLGGFSLVCFLIADFKLQLVENTRSRILKLLNDHKDQESMGEYLTSKEIKSILISFTKNYSI